MTYLPITRRYSRDELIDVGRQCHPTLDFKKIQHAACIDLMSARPRFTVDPMAFTSARKFVPSSSSTTQYNRSSSGSEEERDHAARFNHGRQRRPPWQLRARSNTNSSSDQPISAPLAVDAQKAESFQRFYRAVISPSHVRVTAGGRIVPNYNKPPPVYKYRDDQRFDADNSSSLAMYGPAIRSPEQPFNQRNNSIGETSPSHYDNVFTADTAHTHHHNNKGFSHTMNNQSHTLDNQTFVDLTNVKISPPEQFDPTKPFTYGGRTVYPIHSSGFAPFHLIPGNGALGSMANFQPSFGQHPGSSVHSHMAAPGYSLNSGDSQQDQRITSPSTLPHLSAPTLLKEHMQTLIDTAKFLKDQLEYNKDQIDVDVATAQLEQTEKQIQALEYGMSTQPLKSIFKTEVADLQAAESTKSEGKTSEDLASQASPMIKVEVPDYDLDHIVAAVKGVNDGETAGSSVDSSVTTQGIVPARTLRRSHAIPIVASAPTKTQPKPTSSRLPPTAAKAPEFKPNLKSTFGNTTLGTTANNVQASQVADVHSTSTTHIIKPDGGYTPQVSTWPTTSTHQVTAPMFGQNLRQTGYAASYQHSMPGFLQVPQMAMPHSQHGYNPFAPTSGNYNQTPVSHQTSAGAQGHFVRTTDVPATSATSIPSLTIDAPYLLGFPPPGVSGQVDSRQLLYSRPLNDAEKRARELYWGKAPIEASDGLPKFDGRDFWITPSQKPQAVPANWDLNPSESLFLAELERDAANGHKASVSRPAYNAYELQKPNNGATNIGSVGQFQQNYDVRSRVNSQASIMSLSQPLGSQIVSGSFNSAMPYGGDFKINSLAQAQAFNTAQAANPTKYGSHRSSASAQSIARVSIMGTSFGSQHGSQLGDTDHLVKEPTKSRLRGARSRSKSRDKNRPINPPTSSGSYFQGLKRANMPMAIGAPASSLSTENVTAQPTFGWPGQENSTELMYFPNLKGVGQEGITTKAAPGSSVGSPGIENLDSTMRRARAKISAADLLRLTLRDAPEVANRSSPAKGPISGDDW